MEYEFKNETNDRKYFTMVPNYILNHSSAIDKALYIDIKRAAGENGKCFMTEETMCKRNKIGRERLHKSLKYLLDHKWIKYIGKTSAKTRPIKTYKILDIWKRNVDFYQKEKIVSETAVSKDTVQKEKDTVQNSSKIPSRTGGIRRTILRRTIKKNTRKKYSSLKSITDQDLLEISRRYRVPLSFVKLQLETMTNWLEAKGRKYKNYKRGLMNWVLKASGDKTNLVSPRPLPEKMKAIPYIFIPKDKWGKIRKEVYDKIGR